MTADEAKQELADCRRQLQKLRRSRTDCKSPSIRAYLNERIEFLESVIEAYKRAAKATNH